jgi:hypothetical protein
LIGKHAAVPRNAPEHDDQRRRSRADEAPGDPKVFEAAAVMERKLAGQHKLAFGARARWILCTVPVHESLDPRGFAACQSSRLPE